MLHESTMQPLQGYYIQNSMYINAVNNTLLIPDNTNVYAVNLDIFMCINFCEFAKKYNFACI